MSDQPGDTETVLLHEVTVTLLACDLCLDGVGGECHTPGCAFWMSAAPGVPLREAQRDGSGS